MKERSPNAVRVFGTYSTVEEDERNLYVDCLTITKSWRYFGAMLCNALKTRVRILSRKPMILSQNWCNVVILPHTCKNAGGIVLYPLETRN